MLRDRLELTYDLLEAGKFTSLSPTVLQSGERGMFRSLLDSAVSKIQAFAGVKEEEVDNVVDLMINVFETIPLALQDLMSAKSNTQVIGSLMRAFKMFTRMNLLTSTFDLGRWVADQLTTATLDESELVPLLQSGFEFQWVVSGARSVLKGYKDLQQSVIVEKLSTLLNYFLSFGLFKSLGLSFDNFRYSDFERKKLQGKYSSVEEFIYSILDSTVWFLERGMQAVKLGSFLPFYHSSESYTKWVDSANRLTEDALKMNCPEASGLDEHSFYQRLDTAIEEGESILKYAQDEDDKFYTKRYMRELRLVKAKFVSKDRAQLDRRPPFSVLITGDSCVAKTQFSSILFQQYAKVHGKDPDPKNMWTRNCLDPFYSGYKSSKWCIRLDDAAMFQPAACNGVDPSIADGILLSNGVSLVAPMADLEDKGVVAVRPDFLIVTTNTTDLNAHSYFKCPLALRRRFPWVIELKVKPEFCATAVVGEKDNKRTILTTMIDPAKIPQIEGEIQDTWNITVRKLVAQPTKEGLSTPALEECGTFENIYDFLTYFSARSKEHLISQIKCRNATEEMAHIEICKECFRPKGDKAHCCKCESLQSGELTEEQCWSPEISDDEVTAMMHEEQYQRYLNTGVWNPDYIAHVRRVNALLRESPRAGDTIQLVSRASSVTSEEEEIDALSDFDVTDEMMEDRRSRVTKMMDWVDDSVETIHTIARCLAAGVSASVFHVSDYVLQQASDLMMFYQVRKMKNLFANAGEKIYRTFVNWKVVGLCALLLGAFAIWKTSSFFATTFFGDLQGAEVSDFEKTEKENPWVRDEILLTDFYVPSTTKGWASIPHDEVMKKISQNVVAIKSCWLEGDVKHHIPATACCVGGHVYMTNNHCMPLIDSFEVELTQEPATGNVGKNVKFTVSQSMIYRIAEHDLAFFWCILPPKADLSGLFFKQRFPSLVCNGAYMHSRFQQFPTRNDLSAIHSMKNVHPTLGREMDVWFGTPESATLFGDCGSPLIGFSPVGPIFLGVHQQYMTAAKVSGATSVTRADIDAAFAFFGKQVQCGAPNLRDMKLGPLHNKSVLRWPESGQANIYGSEVGKVWRAAPKSRVVRTKIADAAVSEGFVERCAPPHMKGPEVWHKNVEPTLTQNFLFDKGVLDKCVEGFTEDILSQLQTKQLAEIIKLDDKTTMNGYPGVKFLDKIKRQTSMGFPYRKSKENYILPIPQDEVYSDAVEYTEEVWEEIRLIRDVYARGERYMPVFVMSLKDEPIPLAKVAIKKTRGFMGGPAAWQFVYRQQLLSFVRIFQLNPFVFEGAPGLNCNSCRWREMYRYLTKHGKDRCIAGDYSQFDKRMSPMFILAAFELIVNVLRAAGRPEEDIVAVRCIANDVAYPLTLVQSDLVEFFGSNPSGHALTVIINCIVNSLYIRYVYYLLNPEHTLSGFKDQISLITYGDDNAMNVSKLAPWFTHTEIQRVLAMFDVKYTMADKTAESVPYIPIEEVTFLKRSFVEMPDGRIACPLEWASLDKMLTACVASKTICKEEQSAQTLRSAVMEVFQYGEDKYNEYIPKFRSIVAKAGIEKYVPEETFPDYMYLVSKHLAACENAEHCSGCYEQSE